jgi:hypothetical protein
MCGVLGQTGVCVRGGLMGAGGVTVMGIGAGGK